MTGKPLTIALAIGDPNGIGPEIAVKAAGRLSAAVTLGKPRIVLFGDAFVVKHYARQCAPAMAVRVMDSETLAPATPGTLDVVDVTSLPRDAFTPGQISATAGKATLAYAGAAIAAARAGQADAVIACPHSETAVNASGVRFSGYPSFVATQLGLPSDHVHLMLIGGGLRIVHVTLHEGIAGALARIQQADVERAARVAVMTMRGMGIAQPVIGLMGINPHAGEAGLFGNEDIVITEPAARVLRAEGIEVVGPQGADLLLTNRSIDVFVAMYHDQGHIPIKLLAGRNSAAMSIGGGVVFASVGHGSGFDIAGSLRADPTPLLNTIHLVATGTMMPDSAISPL